jgi:hypothetical protein
MVHVDDGDAKAADHRGAEGKSEKHERDHRDAEQQEAHDRVAPDPAHLPPDDGKQTRLHADHVRRSDQSV